MAKNEKKKKTKRKYHNPQLTNTTATEAREYNGRNDYYGDDYYLWKAGLKK